MPRIQDFQFFFLIEKQIDIHIKKKKIVIPPSSFSNSSTSSMTTRRLIAADEEQSQFWPQMRASTISGDNELRKRSKTRPVILNVDSEATVDTRIARTCCAILESTWYRGELTFHQAKYQTSHPRHLHNSLPSIYQPLIWYLKDQYPSSAS